MNKDTTPFPQPLASQTGISSTIPSLHFVVTCMGRREMIKQTIPHAISQPNTTYTLVDYSCPEGTGAWVKEQYPGANVVFVKDRKSWHASEARNLGAQTITNGWICFVDADTILHPDFSKTVLSTAAEGQYMAFGWQDSWLIGLLVCRQEDFARAGGYDEIIRDWGYEDIDLRRSLQRLGLQMVTIPKGFAESIAHDETVRLQFCGIKDKELSVRVNGFYSLVKDTLLTHGGNISRDRLKEFYRFVRDRVLIGAPWLIWPENDVDPSDYMRLFRNIVNLSRGYKNIEAETLGPVHLFRITRDPDSLVELLTEHNSHQLTIDAPGQSSITVINIYGDKRSIPAQDGRCGVTLGAEPLFFPAGVDIVRDVAIKLAPAYGPALAIELTACSHTIPSEDQLAHLTISIDGEIAVERDLPLGEGANRFVVPISLASLDQPHTAEAAVTVAGRTQFAQRRTTLLHAVSVSPAQARSALMPDRVYRYRLTDPQSNISAQVGWGWTASDLVCWLSVPDASMASPVVVNVLIDAANTRSPHCGGDMEMRARIGAESAGLEFQRWFGDSYWVAVDDAVTAETSPETVACLRLPFDEIGLTPAAGHTLGVTLTISCVDASGEERQLAWGAGTGLTRNPRRYNEITLAPSDMPGRADALV